jgi:hypothetical protein
MNTCVIRPVVTDAATLNQARRLVCHTAWLGKQINAYYILTGKCQTKSFLEKKIIGWGCYTLCNSLFIAQRSLVGQGLLFIETSQSHSVTPQSVGLLWKLECSVAETFYLTVHNTHNREISINPRDLNQQPQDPNGRRPTH